MENDPFPLTKAALVREFNAPLICNGSNAEKVVNKSLRPSSDRAVRFGRGGIAILLLDIV